MSEINDGGPAFPCDELHDQTPPYRHLLASQGISMRDYFAAKAMQGEVAACSQQRAKPEEVAKFAYQVADAMLAAREKQS